MTDPVGVESVDRWLATKRYCLFADWDISMPDRRRLAAEWLFGQWGEWLEFVDRETVGE